MNVNWGQGWLLLYFGIGLVGWVLSMIGVVALLRWTGWNDSPLDGRATLILDIITAIVPATILWALIWFYPVAWAIDWLWRRT
jgi:hypothetical protein